jgi:hypothetical protein
MVKNGSGRNGTPPLDPKSVVEGTCVHVSLEIGGRRSIKTAWGDKKLLPLRNYFFTRGLLVFVLFIFKLYPAPRRPLSLTAELFDGGVVGAKKNGQF